MTDQTYVIEFKIQHPGPNDTDVHQSSVHVPLPTELFEPFEQFFEQFKEAAKQKGFTVIVTTADDPPNV